MASFVRQAKRPRKQDLMGNLVRFCECRVLRGEKLVEEDLWVLDGVVIDPQARFYAVRLSPPSAHTYRQDLSCTP